MNIVEQFTEWFHKKDERIMDLHLKKERRKTNKGN